MQSTLRKNRMKIGILGVLVLTAFVFTIVWINYNSQIEIRESSINEFKADTDLAADFVSHFFDQREDNLKDIISRNVFKTYFENKDLGMTEEYGLGASLVEISNMLDSYVQNKKLYDLPIYKILKFYTADGKLLASSNNSDNFINLDSYASSKNPERSLSAIIKNDNIYFITTQPFFYNKDFTGTLVSVLNTDILTYIILNDHFISEYNNNILFIYNGKYFTFDDFKIVKNIEYKELNHKSFSETVYKENNKKVKYFEYTSSIKGTPFYILNRIPVNNLLGSISPWQTVGAMTLLALIIIAAVLYVLKIDTHNLLLQVHIEESSKQRDIIKENNLHLKEQIIARKEAEKKLQNVNEELEQRVMSRTAELEKQTAMLTREVAERKDAEEALRTFFDNTHDAIIIHDLDGNLITVNERMLEIFKVDEDEALSYSILEDLTASGFVMEDYKEIWEKVLEGQNMRFDWSSRRPKDGSTFDAEIVLNRIELNKIPYILANVRDISERKKIEGQQRENHKFLSTVFEEIGAAIFLFDLESNSLVDCNSKSVELLNMTLEQIKEASCNSEIFFVSDSKKKLLCPEWNGHGIYEEGVLYLPEQKPHPISIHLFEVHFNGKKHIVEVVFDISERKTLERKLSIAQKLESIGLLASGIAHEINTPIQYIGDNIQFLKNAFEDLNELTNLYDRHVKLSPDSDNVVESLQEIGDFREEIDIDFIQEEVPNACVTAQEGVHRVAEIVLAMKNFSHPGEEEFKAVDINNSIENTITVTKNEWKYVADIEIDLQKNLPLINGLPGGINQVLLNILVNAAHAIADDTKKQKGKIKISTRSTGEDVEIKISDSGCGISKENMAKVFDPFFTTKEIGKGTGQGLAIAHDIIVEKHNGSIDIESESGVGTTFMIRLPIMKNEDPASTAFRG